MGIYYAVLTDLGKMLRNMSVFYIFVVLLYSVVRQVSSQPLIPNISDTETDALSARHYYHIDPSTGSQLVCDKCPAGTFVSRHCTQTNVRECSRCNEGTFTRGENGVLQCHRCRRPCHASFIEKVPCTATSDRVCVCPPDHFARADTCTPHSLCPIGSGVKKRGSEVEDVRCKVCARGSFSDMASSVLRCRAHTDCQAQSLNIQTPGTREKDNVCGPASPPSPSILVNSTSSSPGPAQQDTFIRTAGAEDLELLLSIAGTLPSRGQDPIAAGYSEAGPEDDGGVLNLAATPGAQSHTLPHSERSVPNESQPVPSAAKKQATDGMEDASDVGRGAQGSGYRPIRRGSPRPSTHRHFDINEHLPWMIVLLLLLVLVVIVVCSVKRSSRVLKKGPVQDPSSIIEKAIQKKTCPPTQTKEKWIYYSNGQGVDILKLVAAQIGSQWIDMYQSLANATEREVAAFSNGYQSDHERAYAALQHWTIRDGDANLAKLINALHRHRRIDVVEKVRGIMEDNPQFDLYHLMTAVNVSPSHGPVHKPSESSGVVVEQSPVDRTKGFFPDESEPLLRCDSTSSKDSALSRTGSFITKEKKDTVLRQVRLDSCDLQPIFDDMLHILNPDELHVIEEIPMAEDKLDRLFEIAGVKSQEASQTLLDSVYSHLPDLL
ncbi:tumor necrosis factor receptor superfamily member 21 isoform X1 [Esox lucius]|uniref:tumor necrosis factor receptor superfamily member 21 isoform X1 n=1 Tax=Esox lucius TaxID=8010 RepID=UPI00057611EC|nr:tumor necrosis factor receptor superfamily member 21 isoform X1 [Esox lucius]